MSFGNRYFAFRKPVRWFHAVGLSESNTYVHGSSRAIDIVHAQVLAGPGDVLHALSGSGFLVRADDTVEEGRFKLPKHLFEKTYGPPETMVDILIGFAKRGLCEEIAAPGARPDYAAPRKAINARRFPPVTGPITPEGYIPSPVLDHLRHLASSGLAHAVTSVGGTIQEIDVGQTLGDPHTLEARLAITLADKRRIDLRLSPTMDSVLITTSEAAAEILDRAASSCTALDRRSPTIAFAPLPQAESVLKDLADRLG